jgi:drug/metabolite transporter (DMT)-like permease
LSKIGKNQAIPILGFGLISISFSSIFIKWCVAPALVIAFYRLFIASIFYFGVTAIKREAGWSKLSGKFRLLALLSGLFLAAHFAFWITSLEHTSVASSVILVQTAPIFVVLGSALFLKEKPSQLMLLGILITIAGTLLISILDFRSEGSSLFGNVLAIGGAIGAAGYLLIGRKLREHLNTTSYVTIVYSIAAFASFFLVVINRQSFSNYDLTTFLLFVAIGMVPQAIGHTSLNWALKYFSATAVSIATLAEPVGATILAVTLLGESLNAMKIVGGIIILSGVAVVLLSEKRSGKQIEQVD